MKRYACFVNLLLLLPLFSFAQYHYIIEGKFDNSKLGDAHPYSFKDGDSVKLEFPEAGPVYTTVVKNGRFRFEGDASTPSVPMLNLKKTGAKVFLDSSRYIYTFTQEEFEKGKVGYSAEVETTSPFYHLWRSVFEKSGALERKRRELQQLIEKSGPGYEKNAYLEELAMVERNLSDLFLKAAADHKGTYEMTYILTGDPNFSYDRYIRFYNELPDSVKNSFYGQRLYKKLMAEKK
ncbi:DUF4369 domain-containing protein [Chitinophaga eiseniae]|nr:DUF4369 domain-containing protein [Chitinophaga eiseniae]